METINLGKKTIIAIVITLLLTNVVAAITTIVNGQADGIAVYTLFGLIRFALLATILYYLYKGNKIAKWLTVIASLICGISGLLVSLLTLLLESNVVLTATKIINIVLAVIYIIIGIVLIVSRPVKYFLKLQRGEFEEESNGDIIIR